MKALRILKTPVLLFLILWTILGHAEQITILPHSMEDMLNVTTEGGLSSVVFDPRRNPFEKRFNVGVNTISKDSCYGDSLLAVDKNHVEICKGQFFYYPSAYKDVDMIYYADRMEDGKLIGIKDFGRPVTDLEKAQSFDPKSVYTTVGCFNDFCNRTVTEVLLSYKGPSPDHYDYDRGDYWNFNVIFSNGKVWITKRSQRRWRGDRITHKIVSLERVKAIASFILEGDFLVLPYPFTVSHPPM